MPKMMKFDDIWINPALVLYVDRELITHKTVIHFAGKDVKVSASVETVVGALQGA
jgi:hypothetical protein